MCVTHGKQTNKQTDAGFLDIFSDLSCICLPFLSIKVKSNLNVCSQANKTLRSQSVDLIQENMRLKAEVTSRSPQK